MSLDVQGIEEVVYNMAATESHASALRALLGNGASSIIHAEDMRHKPLPKTPFIAIRRLGSSGIGADPRFITFMWYVYDQPERRFRYINNILGELEVLYNRYNWPGDGSRGITQPSSGSIIGEMEAGNESAEGYDDKAGLNFGFLQVLVTAI